MLREAGYHTAISGKHHMGKNADPAFVEISKGRGPGLEGDWVQMLRDRPKEKPFFFWFASTDAHRSWQESEEAPPYDPAKIVVPPYLVDGPVTRQDFADYYHEVSRTDHYLGKLREELDHQGIAENTCVIYMSDNGRPFPRCKTRLYDSGIRTPLLIAMPRKIRPNSSASLVSANLDIGLTILELAGVPRDPRMQGVSLVPLFNDPTSSVRDYAFAEHNWHVHQAHERMVRHGDWLYIRNAWPERQSMCVESSPKYPSGQELWAAHKEGKLSLEQRDIFQVPRPAEELYQVSVDRHQLTNVALVPENQPILAKMRAVLDRWTNETGDTVPTNPTNDREDAFGKKNTNYRLGTFPGAERNATSIAAPGPIREN
jgi:arylsulfatase